MLYNSLIIFMLSTTLMAAGSAYHYKSKFDTLSIHSHINNKSTILLVRELSNLATDIRIATYPTECDKRTKEIIGEACDLGSYMEWAGPTLEQETDKLLALVEQEK